MDPYAARIIPLALLCGSALVGLTIIMLSITRRPRRDNSIPTDDVRLRLERIEQAVDAIAIEVERISEGQRFTSRLLAERGEVPARVPAKQITPH